MGQYHNDLRNNILKVIQGHECSEQIIHSRVFSIVSKYIKEEYFTKVIFDVVLPAEPSGRTTLIPHNLYTALLLCGEVVPFYSVSSNYTLKIRNREYIYNPKKRELQINLK